MKYFLSLLILLTSCNAAKKLPQEPRPVKTQTIEILSSSRARSFAGLTKVRVESRLSFKISGNIEKLPVKVGDRLSKGDLIAQLDRTDYSLEEEEVKAAVFNAKSKLGYAKKSYTRMQMLYETEAISKDDYDLARMQFETAKAAFNAARQKLRLCRCRTNYTTLVAPGDGSVAGVYVQLNENVATGQEVILFNRDGELEVSASVPEALISKIEKGNRAIVNIDAFPGKTFAAIVDEVGVNARGGSAYQVNVLLQEHPEGLRSGMAAEVQFSFDIDGPELTFVPLEAVEVLDGIHYVYIATAVDENVAVIRKQVVEVGSLTNNGLEIFKGLKTGDQVVTAGLHFIEDGMHVKR